MTADDTSSTVKKPANRRWFDVVGAIVLAWFLSFLGPLSFLFPVQALGVLLRFVSGRRFVAAVLFVALNPFGLSAWMGFVDYATGNAHLRFSGLPGTKFLNLDRELRCGTATYGCIVDGSEWITQLPYNATVRLLTKSFGYMPGTYTGPYPTESEAKTALVAAPAIPAEVLKADHLVIGDDAVTLDQGVGEQLLKRLQSLEELWPPEFDRTIHGCIWQRDVVLLRIPSQGYGDAKQNSAVIVVFSRAAGRPFAYYGEGNYSHHFPPVRWKRDKQSKND